MTDTPARAPFRPIFAATITPATIEPKTSATGTNYLLLSGATVQTKDGKSSVRTVMAFGKSADAAGPLLETGKPVELACQHDRGTVKIIGEVRDAA